MSRERPEHEFLRLCVRRTVTPTDEASIAPLLAALDWAYVLALAARHQVLPALHDGLSAMAGGAAPRVTVDELGRWLERLRAYNRCAASELVRLHRCATAAGIPMLSFKGPVLATTLYGGIGARQFADLDVLVDPRSAADAERCFSELGYRWKRDYEYEVALINDTGLTVDLHRALSPDNFPVSVKFAGLWKRRETVALEEGDVETFCASDLAIALCIEAVKDARVGKVRLGKVSDLARLFGTFGDTDWTMLTTEARRLGLSQVLRFSIQLTADVLRIRVPMPPRIGGRPQRWELFLRRAEEALFDGPETWRPTKREGDLFHFHIRERWRDRLRPYGRKLRGLLVPTADDRSVLPLPQPLSFLYYLIRPMRLAHKCGARLIRHRQ
jgi:hypothetical protein